MDTGRLTPAQQRVVDDLFAAGQPRPTFAPSLGRDLQHDLEVALAPLADSIAPDVLWISKHGLARIHACEAHYLAEKDAGFDWSVSTAEGVVAHRAIQLSVGMRGDPIPQELVDHAIDELAADEFGSLGPFLARELSVPARVELRARATNAVSTFLECWPVLPDHWWPRTELPVRAVLCHDRVVLAGKIDLVLGRAIGNEARCLFVDLKTGGSYSSHLDDLRFYALVQTLRLGVPPFRIATYYLESASFAAEDVTVETLEIAARRAVDGARKIAEVTSGQRPASLTPGPPCRYCRIRGTCEGARAWAARNNAEADPEADADAEADPEADPEAD